MTWELLKKLDKEVHVHPYSREQASRRTEKLAKICSDYLDTNPRLAIAAAESIQLWSADKEAAELVLKQIIQTKVDDRPPMSFKAYLCLVHLGCNTQEDIDYYCSFLQRIAEAHWQKRPEFACKVAVTAVKDCDNCDTTEKIVDVLKKMAEAYH